MLAESDRFAGSRAREKKKKEEHNTHTHKTADTLLSQPKSEPSTGRTERDRLFGQLSPTTAEGEREKIEETLLLLTVS